MGVKTFLLMAGGTGGHIFPALAVADSLRARGHHVIWLGSEGSMEERIVPQYDILLKTLAIKGVRGNGIKRKLMLPFTLYKTVREAQRIIRKHRVECVIGFGGFVTFPGGLATKLCGVHSIEVMTYLFACADNNSFALPKAVEQQADKLMQLSKPCFNRDQEAWWRQKWCTSGS